jgi:hypothetical protein
MNEDFINTNSQIKYAENDMFINDKLELIRIQTITKLSTFPDQTIICTAKKQQYSVSQSSNNLVLKTNEGIDVSTFNDLSKLSPYQQVKLCFVLLTSMFKIAEVENCYSSSTKHLRNANIKTSNTVSFNPLIKHDDALFNNNNEKIFDKTWCTNAYLKFKKLHDIIDSNDFTHYGLATTSVNSTYTPSIQTIPNANSKRF